MHPTEMDRLIEEHLRAEDAGDLDATVALYTDDVEHDVVGAPGGPLRGPAAARARYAELLGNVRTDEMLLRRRYHATDACIVEHRGRRDGGRAVRRGPGERSPGAVPAAARLRVRPRPDQPGERVDGHRDRDGAAL